MIWEQRHFWRTWLAWWVDGCPPPETWYRMRVTQHAVERLGRAIREAMFPAKRAAEAAAEFARILKAHPPA